MDSRDFMIESRWFRILSITPFCPKCNSREIYRVEAVDGHTYGAGNVIPTGVIDTIKVNRYVCG